MPVNKRKRIEEEQKKPIAVILREMYAKHGNQTEVAKALGVSQPRISEWIRQLGLREWTIIIPNANREDSAREG